jgi:hypothetical protein
LIAFNKNYFYKVTAVADVESAPSNMAGKFDYNLTMTSGTDINEIGGESLHVEITAKDLQHAWH